MFSRLLQLPNKPKRSFFLWGPRLCGKTSLLKTVYPTAFRIDLLKSELFARYKQRPHTLREEIELMTHQPDLVIIDEVQKVPELLDEVHYLIEDRNIVFGLCGSSARRLKKGQANLLGGRALRYELSGLVSAEVGEQFDILRALNHGYLPINYLDDDPNPGLRSYVADYLKEEIMAEGLVRNLPAFSRFLDVAAIMDTEIVMYSNAASDCGVSAPTVKEYFQILVDTLLGSFLPAYTKRPKRKIIQAPKFYMSDVGIVNILARRGPIEWGSQLCGPAFENWLFHELNARRLYGGDKFTLHFWRLAQGIEVDFIINDMEFAIELKSTDRIGNQHLKGLRELLREHSKIKRRIVVCNEASVRKTEDGIEILPAKFFAQQLWGGEFG